MSFCRGLAAIRDQKVLEENHFVCSDGTNIYIINIKCTLNGPIRSKQIFLFYYIRIQHAFKVNRIVHQMHPSVE